MGSIVFTEKMRRPDPSGLPRPRLEARLVGPAAPSVGLVLGPAGSGKTTLVTRVAAQNVRPSAWYRAGVEDNDEAALVAHLGHALGTVLDDPAVVAAGGLGTVTALVTALEEGPATAVQLVVDDLHELIGSEAESALEQFCRWRPRHIQLLLASRRPPGFDTSRWLVSGELGQLDAEDLRFRSWEVEDLFRSVYAQPLSPEAAAALTRRTSGWAAGLQLFHLATSGVSRLERERAVDELSGRSRLIRSYLTRNVLDGLDPDRRSFLLQSCTLGVLSATLCDQLLDRSDSAVVLADLEQLQFFTSTSDHGATYRYHQVLQTHLEVLLADECGTAPARRLYARSAELLEAAGLFSSALRAHARAEDWGAVARLLQHTSSALPVDDRFWLSRLPGVAHDDPGLVLANARRMLRSGRVADAVEGFRTAESLLDDPDFQARCQRERAVAAQWLATAPEPDRRQPVPSDRTVRLSQELRLMTRSVRDPRWATSALARGVGLLLAGDRRAASAQLREPDAQASGWERLAVTLAAQVADVDETPDPSAAFEQIVLGADLEGLPWLARLARGWQAAALLRAEPTDSRVASALDLVEACDRQADHWGAALLALAFGASLVRPRPERSEFVPDHAVAVRLLRLALARAEELGAPVLGVWAAELLAVAAPAEPVRDRSGSMGRADQLGVRLDDLAGFASPTTPATNRPALPPAAPREPGKRGIRVSCLGRFDLTVDGRAVPWRGLRPRSRSLLMLLALHQGRNRHRETLIADLWPDATLASGLRSLQVAISSVRLCLASAGLAEDSVLRQGDAYALSLPGAQVELDDFEHTVRTAARAEASGELHVALRQRMDALDLYAGDLLPETGPAEWVVPERERLRALAARTGADAARLALALDELPSGLWAAHRSLELDPYHDQSWQLLADLCERSGDHTAAAVARRDHERMCSALGL